MRVPPGCHRAHGLATYTHRSPTQTNLPGNALIQMAKITCWSSDFQQLDKLALDEHILNWVMRAEKRTFPRNEVFDFDGELKKRNTELMIVLNEALLPESTALMAYLIYASHKNTALLHKVCVLKTYRRQGIATRMLQLQKERLGSRGCDIVKLWVDEKREPARCLYARIGFKEVDRLEDYYALGRTGVQMVLSLLPI